MRPPHRTGHGGDFEISVDSPRPRTAFSRLRNDLYCVEWDVKL